MKRLLTLLLIVPLLFTFGCLKENKEINKKIEERVLKELGYRGLTFYERVGGHTIRRHVGKKYSYLVRRLKEEPRLKAASTFYDLKTAERVVERAIYFNREKIQRWLKRENSPDKLVLIYRGEEPIGVKVERAGRNSFRESVCTDARVILKKDRKFGFIVLTAYPT